VLQPGPGQAVLLPALLAACVDRPVMRPISCSLGWYRVRVHAIAIAALR